MRDRIDEQPRRVRFLGEECSVEHRRLEHRNLQPSDQHFYAVGQVLGLEDEIEKHRHQLDGHRFELVGLGADRRFLQVAKDVVHPLRNAGELDGDAADVEAGFALLQA